MRLACLALLASIGCGGDKSGGDADGDGVAGSEDCDDGNALVFPGKDEVCNGVDDNCDDRIDEGVATAWYKDNDGDGAGVSDGPPNLQCTAPTGYVANQNDCDDTRADVNPRAVEDCGEVDLNCDGDPTAGATGLWFIDQDGDGFGDSEDDVNEDCDPGAGWVAEGGDCDDAARTTFPGAPELCDEGVDNDCDPVTTDDDAPDAPSWYADLDGDGHGDPAGGVFRGCTQPVGTAAPDDDCNDADATSFPGNFELCDAGVDNDCDPTTDEEETALWFRDLDEDGYGDDLDQFTGCSPPPGYIQVPGDCDDTDATLNPNLTPGCVQIHCGTFGQSQLWKSTVDHLVTCDVEIEGAAKPILTIQDGTIVRFDQGAELRIGKDAEGELRVEGDALGVLFTANQAIPVAGDWDGLLIGAQDRGSSIVGLTVEYAGGNGEGGVTVDGGNPEFDRLTSRNNLGDGLFVSGSEPLVHDSFLVDNTNNGLFVDEGAGLSRTPLLGGSGPSFTDNVITGNAAIPITIPGSHADEIDLSNVLVPNVEDEIELLSGVLRFGGTWFDHGIPYRVADGATIDVEDGPQAVLTIEDGVEVFFGIDSEITVGDGAGGRLLMEDGPEGILFSATDEVVALSDNWEGVLFGLNDDGSELRNLTIEYGGANGKGNLYVKGSAPLFDGVTSRQSDSAGLYVSGATAAPEIRNSTFVDNDQDGVFVESSSGLARSVLGATFANNLLTNNGESSIVVPPNFIGELDPSTQFSGNNKPIRVHPGDVLVDALWRRLDDAYQVIGQIDVGGPQDPVLEIEDGVEIRFDRDTELTAGIADEGALVIEGAVLGVLMTSSDPAPGEGDWDGIQIGRNGSGGSQTRLRGLTIEFAGGSDVDVGGALEIIDDNNCQSLEPLVDLDDITIRSSSKSGLFLDNQTQTTIDGFVIDGALDGCIGIDSDGGCPGAQILSFTNNVCSAADFFGAFPIGEADELDATSTYSSDVILTGTIVKADVRIPALPVATVIPEMVDVNDLARPVLTISAGARVKFDTGAGLEIADGKPGALVIEPGALLTSNQPNPAPGDWEGIYVGDDCTSAMNLSGGEIAFAGGNGDGALSLDNCFAGVYADMTISDSSTCGVFLDYDLGDEPPTLTDFVYVQNALGEVCSAP